MIYKLFPKYLPIQCYCPMYSQVYRRYGMEYGDITSPNITYQYYMPDAEPTEKIIEGRWTTIISSCSVTCGSGTREVTSKWMSLSWLLITQQKKTYWFVALILLSFLIQWMNWLEATVVPWLAERFWVWTCQLTTGYSKLSLSVNVCVNDCSSLC